MTNLDSILKNRNITLLANFHLFKAMVFPLVMYGCEWSEVAWLCLTLGGPMDCSLPGSSVHGIFQARILEWVAISFSRDGCESWTIKKTEHQRIVAFELWCWRRLLGCKEIQPVHPKGDQSWVFIGRTDAEAETPTLWLPDAKNWLIWKDPNVGKDWRLEEKGTSEDEIIGWHHWLNGCEFGWTLGVGDEQGGLASCTPWGCQESDTTEWLNWTDNRYRFLLQRNCHTFLEWLYNFIFPPAMCGRSSVSASLPAFILLSLILAFLIGVLWCVFVLIILISPLASDVEQLVLCVFAFPVSSSVKHLVIFSTFLLFSSLSLLPRYLPQYF